MPTLKRAPLVLLAVFGLMATLEWFNVFAPVDRWFYNLSLSFSTSTTDNFVDYVAAVGGTTVIGAWVAGLLVVAWWRSESRTLIAVGVMALVVGELIELGCKTVIAHSGPQARVLDVGSLPFEGKGSFPSGHTLRVTVVSVITAMVLTQKWPTKKAIWRALGIAVVVVVSAARVYLGDHWFSDVMGSWLLGAGLLGVGFALAPSIKSRFKP